ncbi:hypothetical protein JTB14_001070 [Gonioctena quinquepunctata]|nr:hypothetical protein JTB14_001070 [Gonioctena quinquepunctata]
MLPGEGARFLKISQEIMMFISKIKVLSGEVRNISNSLLGIMNQVLSSPHSLTKQSEVRIVIELINEHLSTLASRLVSQHDPYNHYSSFETIDLTILNISYGGNSGYFHIPINHQGPPGYHSWVGAQFLGTNIVNDQNKNSRLVSGVIFKHLSSFLPPRSFLRMKDGSEIEYEIYSQIMCIFPQPKSLDIYPIAIDFKHELNNNMNWSNGETWSVKCGYADLSTFTYTWDIHSCYTETLSDSKSRCICSRSGIFALLLTLSPKSTDGESSPKQYIISTGCCFGMVLALFTTACLATSCFLLKKSCLVALKLQCSISIFATGFMFTLATITGPPQAHFWFFITTIEISLLFGMSSHLSKILIIFTDLTDLPKSINFKYTVTGIISGNYVVV